MISVKYASIIAVAAFVSGSFVASPELRAYAANTVGSADIINNSILSADIKDGEVKTVDLGGNAVTSAKIAAGGVANSDIASNAVTGSKIEDGTIAYGDVSRALVAIEHRNDCNCGGTGWDPDGTHNAELIFDDRISKNSAVSVTMTGGFALTCGTYGATNASLDLPASVAVKCTTNIPGGTGVSYAIFNNPAYS